MSDLRPLNPDLRIIFKGYSNDISEERNQKQNESILDLDVDGTKGTINKFPILFIKHFIVIWGIFINMNSYKMQKETYK